MVGGREGLRDLAVAHAAPGDWAEFGVHEGKGARALLGRMPPDVRLHLFDSWEGIREPWDRGDMVRPVGFWRCDQPDLGDDRCVYWRGWFDETAPAFAETDQPLGLVSLDCDSYESTRDALLGVRPCLSSQTVLLMWVLFSHSNWRSNQHRVLRELGRPYEVLGRAPGGQAAVRVTWD